MPVIPGPSTRAGLNYAEHVTEAAAKRGEEPNSRPSADVGYRANNALIAHDEPIVIPKDADRAGAIRGRTRRGHWHQGQVPEGGRGTLLRLGWTIGNDMSERTWQRQRPHAVARQEHRHLQADGAVDRDRFRPRQRR